MKDYISISGIYENYCFEKLTFSREYNEIIKIESRVKLPCFKREVNVTKIDSGFYKMEFFGSKYEISEKESDFKIEESYSSFEDVCYNVIIGKIKLIRK